MSLESTKKVMNQYFSGHEPGAITFSDDVVFTIMATGQEHRGPEEVSHLKTTASSAAGCISRCRC